MVNVHNYVDSPSDAIPKEGLKPFLTFLETICLLSVLTFAVAMSALHWDKSQILCVNPMKRCYFPANVHWV